MSNTVRYQYGTATKCNPSPNGAFELVTCDKCGKTTRSAGMGVHLKYCTDGIEDPLMRAVFANFAESYRLVYVLHEIANIKGEIKRGEW